MNRPGRENACNRPSSPSNLGIRTQVVGYAEYLIISKGLDVRRRGATTEAYGVIRRKPAPAKAGGGAIEGNATNDALMVDQGIG
jgi:hypothetical protein